MKKILLSSELSRIETALFCMFTTLMVLSFAVTGAKIENICLDVFSIWFVCVSIYGSLLCKTNRLWAIIATVISLIVLFAVGLIVNDSHSISSGFLFGGLIWSVVYICTIALCAIGLWFVWIVLFSIYNGIRSIAKRHR